VAPGFDRLHLQDFRLKRTTGLEPATLTLAEVIGTVRTSHALVHSVRPAARPGTGRPTRGSTMPYSTAADRSSTKVESWRRRGCMRVGLPLLRRRKSSFLDGIGADTIDLTIHLRAHLDRNMAAA